MVEEEIKNAIKKSLKIIGLETKDIVLEHPSLLSHGDYSSNVALVLAKEANKKPRELAEDIVREIQKEQHAFIEKIEVAGPGFINFHLSSSFFVEETRSILKKGNKWGRNEIRKGEKIMVEYTDPNLFKPFHIGHLMANAIGESVSRLIEFSGAEVKRANYQGDVGLHVAKAIWGMMQKNYDGSDIKEIGDAYVFGNSAYEENEEHKKEIISLNKKIYDKSDEGVNKLYNKGRETSLKKFEEIYALLDTVHDLSFFEGETWENGKKAVEENTGSVFEKSEGAVVFHGEKYDLHTRVFISSAGLPTYEAKEIGLALAKREVYPFDLSITVAAIEQDKYFDVVFKAIELLHPEFQGKLKHIHHGMMQLKEGKMSSRKGNVITGESLLSDIRNLAKKVVEGRELGDEEQGVIDSVAVAAIKYSILKQHSGHNIVFDPQKSLSFEGDSGPYLQYTYTRAQSVLEKAEKEGVTLNTSKYTDVVTDIEKLLYRFPLVVERSQREYEPHYVAVYLTELSSAFNSWYAQEKILDGSTKVPYKCALTKAVALTLKNGLWLLGIKAPERM